MACTRSCQPSYTHVSPTEANFYLKRDLRNVSPLCAGGPVALLPCGFRSQSRRCQRSSKGRQARRLGSCGNLRQRRRGLHLGIYAKADDLPPSEMTLENALQLLGVKESATFDEILNAKKVKVDSSGGDPEKVTQVEAAYDILLMQSLYKRRAGQVVDTSVLYADVRKPKAQSSGPEWLQKALKTAPFSVATPPNNELAIQAGVYGALAIWTLLGGLGDAEGGSGSSAADVPGLQLALGFSASLYFLNRQNLKLGKAAALTVSGLVIGATLGNLIESWLRVDIVPVLGISSPSVVVGEFVLVFFFLVSSFVR